MEKDTKKFLVTVGTSFAAGMAVMMIACTLCCCPAKMGHKPMAKHRPNVEMMHKWKHHKDFGFREPTPEMREKFAQKLGLTDEQKEILEKYRVEDMKKIEELLAKKKALREEFKAAREEGRAHFESVLTDEQKEILKTMKKHHHKGHHFGDRKGADVNVEAVDVEAVNAIVENATETVDREVKAVEETVDANVKAVEEEVNEISDKAQAVIDAINAENGGNVVEEAPEVNE